MKKEHNLAENICWVFLLPQAFFLSKEKREKVIVALTLPGAIYYGIKLLEGIR